MNDEKINHCFVPIWKKCKVDHKGRVLLPKILRQELGLNGDSQILWISILQKNNNSKEFLINVGVKK